MAFNFQSDGAVADRPAARDGARKRTNRVRLSQWSGRGCVKSKRPLFAGAKLFHVVECFAPTGSLAASVFDPDVYLVGGSGGVYALLAAHVANVFLNFAHIDCGLCWVIVSVFVGGYNNGWLLDSIG